MTDWANLLTAFVLATQQYADVPVRYPTALNPPAEVQKIERLESRAGVRLPDEFKAFLRHSDGIRNFAVDTDLYSIDQLLENYRAAERVGGYGKWLDQNLLYGTGIGHGVLANQLLMVQEFNGDATLLIVDPRSEYYGKVIAFHPGSSFLYGDWSDLFEHQTNDLAESRRRRALGLKPREIRDLTWARTVAILEALIAYCPERDPVNAKLYRDNLTGTLDRRSDAYVEKARARQDFRELRERERARIARLNVADTRWECEEAIGGFAAADLKRQHQD